MKKIVIATIIMALAVAPLVPTACAKPAEFEVNALNISPTEVVKGEPATVTIDVGNTGGSEGTYIATLTIDGVETESKEITLAAGSTETVVFTVTKDTPGTYRVELGELSGILKVLRPAEFKIGHLVITPKLVLVGEPAIANVEITNVGEATDTLKAILKVDGVEVETKEVIILGGETKAVSFEVIRYIGGDCAVEIDGATGNLCVAKLITYSSPKYAYSISYPEDWRLDASDEANVSMMTPVGFPILMVAVDVLEEEPTLTLEERYQAGIEEMSETPGWEILSTKKVREAEALPGYEVIATFTEEGINYKSKMLLMASGRLEFVAMVLAVEDQWDDWAAVSDAILQSFVPPSPEFEPPPVNKIGDTTMARDVDPDTGEPVGVTDTFRATAPVIYCAFKLTCEAGTEIGSRWVLVEGDGMRDEEIMNISTTVEEDIETPVWSNFYITSEEELPVGSYQVTLFLNGEEVVTLPFTVTRR